MKTASAGSSPMTSGLNGLFNGEPNLNLICVCCPTVGFLPFETTLHRSNAHRCLLDDLLVDLGDLAKHLRSRRSDLVDHVELHLEVLAVVPGRIQVVE